MDNFKLEIVFFSSIFIINNIISFLNLFKIKKYYFTIIKFSYRSNNFFYNLLIRSYDHFIIVNKKIMLKFLVEILIIFINYIGFKNYFIKLLFNYQVFVIDKLD